MAVSPPRYSVEVKIDVTVDQVGWPRRGPVRFGFESNRLFENLRDATWADAANALSIEEDVLGRCLHDATDSEDFDRLLDEILEDEFDSFETNLDFGTIAATLALNAAGCPTITSCSGHHHGIGYPQVVFWTRPHRLALLMQAAETADVGLLAGDLGWLEAYSDSMDGLMRFCRALLSLERAFGGARRSPRRLVGKTRRTS